jgi:hypothetical protein
LKRRERRKKRGREDPPDLEAKSLKPVANSKPLEKHTPDIQLDDSDPYWRYDSREPGLKGSWGEAPRNPAIAHIKFGNAISEPSKESFDPPTGATDVMATPPSTVMPQIIIRSSVKFETSNQSETKRFHVMYDGTVTSSRSSAETPQGTTTDSAKNAKSSHSDISPTGDSPIHVADLIDEVDFISTGSYDPKLFISAIELKPFAASPSSKLGLIDEEVSNISSSPLSRIDYEEYWQKFSVLICGYIYPFDVREAPYSLGYGSDHSNPPLVRRSHRWGYYDVDNVCTSSGRPRWRAAWKFEVSHILERDILLLCGQNI